MAKTKYVKLYEQLDNEGVLDSDDSGKKKEYRPGQKAAIARGDDILSDQQYAACYLNAIRSQERAEDTRGRGDTGLTRNALKMTDQATDDWQNVSSAKLSAYLDLKPQTVERTVSKFKLLLKGEREGTESNVIWPELANLFDTFEAMPKTEVLAMAEEAISSEPDWSDYNDYLATQSESGKKSREKKKATDSEVKREIRKVFLGLVKQFNGDLEKAVRITRKSMSDSFGLEPKSVSILAMQEFKNEPSLKKAWTPSRFEKPESIVVGKGQEQNPEMD